MSESLKKLVSQSIHQFSNTKLVNSIEDLGKDAIDKSFELDSQNDNQMDNKQLLKMEIKQLKRQNAFLKGKIQQFRKANLPQKPQLLKRQSLNYINILKKRPHSKQLFSYQNSVSFILKQIQSILKSLASLHKIQTDQKAWAIQLSSYQLNDQQEQISANLDKQYRQKLHKKLQMISMEKQESRYESLLQIFSEFYQIKAQQEKIIKQKIEKFIEKTIQISKTLIEKANTKSYQKIIRSSCIYSTSNPIKMNTSITHHEISETQSIFYKKTINRQNPQKHDLSYSTIDGQYVIRQVD